MKKVKVEKSATSSTLKVFNLVMEGYHFAPKQMIRFRMQNPVTKGTSIMFGVIESLKFSERLGGAVPLAEVSFVNTWKSGEHSGWMNVEFCPHRYYEGAPSEEEMKIISEIWGEDDVESLFYVDYETSELVFPYSTD